MVRFKVFSLGCKLNHYESEFLREEFLRSGLEESEKADIYVVNTCALTSTAERKSLKLIRRLKRENPQAQIVSTGCLAELSPGRLRNISTYVFSHFDKPFMIKKLLEREIAGRDIWQIKISDFTQRRAFLKIQDGCSRNCTFCFSRIARGPSRSRPLEEIKFELRRLIERGFYEVVLIGLDLVSWRSQDGRKDLADLIKELTRLKGLGRLRLSSLNPQGIGEKLLETIVDNDKVCPHLHLSFQSADSVVLKNMGRNFTKEDCFKLAKAIRRRSIYLGISCDIMLGFPSETQRAFQNTLELLEALLPVKVHIFQFSPRPLTATASFKHTISSQELKKRKEELFASAQRLSYQFRRLNQGRILEAVFDKKKDSFTEGYTDNYIRIRTYQKKTVLDLPVVRVKIKKITEKETLAEII